MMITLIGFSSSLPSLTVKEIVVKLDLGNLLLEIERDSFKYLIESILIQASEQGLNLSTLK